MKTSTVTVAKMVLGTCRCCSVLVADNGFMALVSNHCNTLFTTVIGNLIFDFEVSHNRNRPISPQYRFYIFVCSLCNHGTEFLRKLHMQIEDIIHLFLFNLNKHHNLDYYHVKTVIVPYAQSNWHYLQLHRDVSFYILSSINSH